MDPKDDVMESPERVLASLSPETLDKLADLVVSKLVAKNDRFCFPSKTSWVRNIDKLHFLISYFPIRNQTY